MPIPVTDLIAPTSPSDVYATHDANYGKGGVHHVADVAARNAITSERRRAGMIAYVESEQKHYRLETDLTTWGDLVSVGAGADANYTHTQGVASDTWAITHNLGKRPSVTVIDSGGSEVEGDVEYNTLNSLTLTFSAGFSGQAFLN